MKLLAFLIPITLIFSCSNSKPKEKEKKNDLANGVELVILGTIQDAGSPHIACKKACCKNLFDHPDVTRQVVCLGLIDHNEKKTFLFEATPNINLQCKSLMRHSGIPNKELPDGIFVTHAHIGHYTGLMYLGKEATHAKKMAVYAMPRMKTYLECNGPWSQLVNDSNILLNSIQDEKSIKISNNLTVTPIQVPHRDEYSETVGYLIKGPNKSALFIPDIDKWEKWSKNILDMIKKVDYAFIDGTFYSGKEINNRDISEIPHPMIIESMELFDALSIADKNKIFFIHFNHTNPILNPKSTEHQNILKKGYKIAQFHDRISL